MSTVVSLPPTSVPVRPRTVNAPGLIQECAEHYLGVLARRGRSLNTIASYECDLGQFIGYCESRAVRFVQHVTVVLVEDYIDALARGKHYRSSTLQRKREALRGFLDYQVHLGLIRRNPVDQTMSIKVVTERVIAPEESTLLRVIDSIDASSVLGLRDRAFFRLMFDAACRASEPCRLDVYDPESPPLCTVLPGGSVVFVKKGGGVHSNPIDATTQQYLNDWLAVRPRWAKPSQSALFVSRRGQRVSRHTMHARIKAIGKCAGLPDLHMHLFRHRRAGEVINRLGLRAGSELLDHKNINTTQQCYGHYGEAHRHRQLMEHCALGGGSHDQHD